jgi:hypothetical protein
MAELSGRVADGINVPGGPNLGRLLDVARAARSEAGLDHGPFVVTASSDGSGRSLDHLERHGVDRAVIFIRAPFAEQVTRLSARRR